MSALLKILIGSMISRCCCSLTDQYWNMMCLILPPIFKKIVTMFCANKTCPILPQNLTRRRQLAECAVLNLIEDL